MPDIDLTSISPVTDAEAARLGSPDAFARLASQIAATASAADPASRTWQQSRHGRQDRRLTRRRALLAGLPLAALAGAAALVAGLLIPGGSARPGAGATNGPGAGAAGRPGGSGANSQAAIQAVSFVKENGHITVVIKNPYADSTWYNADFARHHLNIKLTLIPASPSFVGAIEYMSTDSGATSDEIKMITKAGDCGLDGTGCVIGFTIPADFHGQATMGIGRQARPGEQYQTTGSIFNKGEALSGLRSQVMGQPVGKVWPLLASRHLTIAVCRDARNQNVDPAQVPATNYVTNILPWAPNEVIVWTGPTPANSGASGSGSQPVPAPKPTPTSTPAATPGSTPAATPGSTTAVTPATPGSSTAAATAA